ncbi:MAG: Rieske 2Fe-2S domain-containing protein [Bacteroidota bacterium]
MKWYKLFGSAEEARVKVPLMRVVSVLIKAENRRVFLARTPAGFYAADDVCPHLNVQLSKGVCTTYNEITCPWHAYRFSLQTGAETTGQDCGPLTLHPLREDAEGFFIGIGPASELHAGEAE